MKHILQSPIGVLPFHEVFVCFVHTWLVLAYTGKHKERAPKNALRHCAFIIPSLCIDYGFEQINYVSLEFNKQTNQEHILKSLVKCLQSIIRIRASIPSKSCSFCPSPQTYELKLISVCSNGQIYTSIVQTSNSNGNTKMELSIFNHMQLAPRQIYMLIDSINLITTDQKPSIDIMVLYRKLAAQLSGLEHLAVEPIAVQFLIVLQGKSHPMWPHPAAQSQRTTGRND